MCIYALLGQVLSGSRLGNSFFLEFCELNKLDPARSEEATSLAIPESLKEHNAKELKSFRGMVLAVRSSAFGERGGIGIYESRFFVPTGDLKRDVEMLGQKEAEVYASFFAPKAIAYQEKHAQAGSELGMGLLIQPVIGQWHEDHFLPAMAGSGYTSLHGKPIIRAVPGLGTRAVDADAIVFEGELPGPEEIVRRLLEIDMVDAIFRDGSVNPVPMTKALGKLIGAQPIIDLHKAMTKARGQTGKDFFFEWACAGEPGNQPVRITQSAPYEDKEITPMDLECEGGKLIAEGADIVHHGRKECKTIIEVEPLAWSTEVRQLLTRLNRDHGGFLLIVPQEATSRAGASMDEGDARLNFSHFSNAAAVLEFTYDTSGTAGVEEYLRSRRLTAVGHGGGRAGQHFQQICDREDILFLGAQMTTLGLKPDESYPEGVKVYNVKAVAVNDVPNKVGRVFILPGEKAEGPEWRVSELESFYNAVRNAAIETEKTDKTLSDHLFKVHYCIPCEQGASGEVDPYNPDPHDLEFAGGIEGLRESISAVLENDGAHFDPVLWNEGLRDYLTRFHARLENRE